MAELAPPLQPIELEEGQSRSFTALRWETGEAIITPGHAPQGKKINVLRIHVRPEDAPGFPHYIDITSARLFAQLRPQLDITGRLIVRWTITAHGIAPKKYFTVERVPAS